MSEDALLSNLRTAYDRAAARRDATAVEGWKAQEREAFLELMREEERTTMLEVGAGPGIHGKWFSDNGLAVTCTDLSPEHIRLCRAKGLEAYVMPFLELDFGERTFDAVFAMNCLLHVPPVDLPLVLERIGETLEPRGLFFLGQYGGETRDGVDESDDYEPKRYFSWLSDEALERAAIEAGFEVIDFHPVDLGSASFHFQSLTLRR